MRRIPLTVLLVLVVGVMPGLAQQSHVLVTPDALKRVDPPTFPGAKLAVVQGRSRQGRSLRVPREVPGQLQDRAPLLHKAVENVTVLRACSSSAMGEKFDQRRGQGDAGRLRSSPSPRRTGISRGRARRRRWSRFTGSGRLDITFVNPADDPRKNGRAGRPRR